MITWAEQLRAALDSEDPRSAVLAIATVLDERTMSYKDARVLVDRIVDRHLLAETKREPHYSPYPATVGALRGWLTDALAHPFAGSVVIDWSESRRVK